MDARRSRQISWGTRFGGLVLVSFLAVGCGPKVEIDYCKASRGGTLGMVITLEGRVQNIGNRPACDVKVEVEWKNPTAPQGVVASESVPVVGPEGLEPGQSRDFKLEEIHGKEDRWQFVCRPVWSGCG
jgi:hypothetical protein